MSDETVKATRTIGAPAEAVFASLADPTTHAEIDGTGWVRGAVDQAQIVEVGQLFRVSMYHENFPGGDYEMTNEVFVLEPPRAIAWRPGYVSSESGDLEFGGWTWRYDLEPVGAEEAEVTLTYDWSAVGPEPRQQLPFPPFPPDHLDNSLSHLAEIAERG